MKGLILSGGRGTRIRPLTHTSAKQLIPVANKPVLFYNIDLMISKNVKEIVVIVSPETGQEVINAVQTAYPGIGSSHTMFEKHISEDLNFYFMLQVKPKGLADAVGLAWPMLHDSDFLMLLGDNIFQDIPTPVGAHSTGYDAEVYLKEVDNPRSFGVATLDREKMSITKLVEKPENPESNLALTGAYYFSPRIFEAIKQITISARGELEITDAIQKLIDMGGDVYPNLLGDSYWLDTGKKDDILSANQVVMNHWDKKQIIGTSIIEDCIIRGPAIIGNDCVIKNSFIGSYVAIDDGCIIENADINYSIIRKSVEIKGVSLDESIVGVGSKVVKSNRLPTHAMKLLIGDDSVMEV